MKRTRVALCITSLVFAAALAAGCATAEEHNMTLVPEQEATCTEAGHEQYYSCSDCGKYFADAQGNTEISLDDIAIPALGHDLEQVAAAEATCTQAGHSAYYQCTRCDAMFSDAEGTRVVTEEDVNNAPALGHEMEIVSRVEPTYDADGHIAYYECSRCHNKYADSYGDQQYTDDDVLLPKYENIGTVTLTFTAYQNGETTTPSFSEEQITLTSRNVEGKTLTGVANSASASIQNAYNDDYTVVVGDYTGEVSFTEGTTAYSVELQYQYVTDTSVGETSSVDLTYMNDADHTIIMNETRNNTGVSSWAKATFTLPEAVAESTNVAVGFTIRWLSGTNTTNLNGFARFGVQMAGDDGIFVAMMGPNDGGGYPLQVAAIRDSEHTGGIFDTDGLSYGSSDWLYYGGDTYTDASDAAKGLDGLPVIVVRMGGSIRMYICLNDVWMLIGGPVTCDAEAETAISLLVGGHEWEFSDITFGEVTWNEYQEATPTEPGYIAHYAFNGMLFDADGNVLTEEDVYIAPTTPHASVTFTSVTGNKYNDATNKSEQISLSGTIKLTDSEGGTITGTLTDGAATLQNVYRRTYAVEVTAENGDIFDGSVTIGEETSYVFPTKKANCLQYRYAAFSSTIEAAGGSYTLDTSAMNNKHHKIGINNANGPSRTDYYTMATFTISDEVAASKYVVMDFWLSFLGTGFNAISRFGVMMADREGIGVAPMSQNTLHVYPLYGGISGPDDMFDGYNVVDYATAVSNALTSSSGMHIQVVRMDTNIYMYAYVDNAWVLLGQTTCETDDVTQVSFVVLNGSWSINDPSIATMTYVAEQEATSDTTGNIAHYTWTTPNTGYDEYGVTYYFNTDGSKTTLEDVTTGSLASVTLTVNGKKDGTTSPLSGSLSGAFGDLTVTGNVENGSVTLTDIGVGTYTLTLTDGDGVIWTGEVTIEMGTTSYSVTLQYPYATDTSVGGTATVDLSGMNDAEHTIVMNETTANTGTTNWAEATLSLSDALKSSKNVTVEFTVTATGSFNAYSRFGVMMAGRNGVFVFITNATSGYNFDVIAMNPDNPLGIFDGATGGLSADHDAVMAALQGNGLQVRVVREDTTITMYLYLNGTWKAMVFSGAAEGAANGTATCETDDETDIRFCVGGNGSNTWTFSNITYSVTGAQN